MKSRTLYSLVFILLSIAATPKVRALDWRQLPDMNAELGVAGPFTGVYENTLILAGGANFPEPVWENDKVWHDTIYTLNLSDSNAEWVIAGSLPRPLAYGACVSVDQGIVLIGGADSTTVYDTVYLLRLDEGSPVIEELPNLPTPLVYSAATRLGKAIYLAGGSSTQELETATNQLWRLDLERWATTGAADWEALEPIPGPPRALSQIAAQNNGETDCIYVLGGRHINEDGDVEFLKDTYEFNPLNPIDPWRQRADIPTPWAAGTAVPIGQSHIYTLAGEDGALFGQADALKDSHPGFPKTIYAYHTITDQWIEAGETPESRVTTHAASWNDGYILASGETRPRVRTKSVWFANVTSKEPDFAVANWIAITLYLLLVVGIGIYFGRKNTSTEDYFRGGQSVPSVVAGLSIFATMLSSITFIALPARAYATDWTFAVINLGILAVAPFVASVIIPKFRGINITSAYEYLESRFHISIRLFASASFVLYQIGRTAIVLYLPSLALAAITPVSVTNCILIMGVLSVAYATFGGLKAVVWTDALQSVVLLTGAGLSLILIVNALDGGWSELASTAITDHKLRLANLDFSRTSYMTNALWVMILGAFGNALIPYCSDQAVVQRYVSTSSEQKARSAVWLNATLSMVATVLFFGLGTALYAFYKGHPAALDPGLNTDSIYPLYISSQLPIGVSGIVIAAVFAAAQSTISTSINSASTAIVTDFFRRLGWKTSEKGWLALARLTALVFGILGTAFAIVLAQSDLKSAWETFLAIIGLAMGPLCGVFLLGVLSRSATTQAAVCGVVSGILALVWTRYFTNTIGILYSVIGITVTWTVGSFVTRMTRK